MENNKNTKNEQGETKLSLDDIQTMIIGSKERFYLLNIFNNLVNSVETLRKENEKLKESVNQLGEKIAKDNNIP